MSDIWGVGPVNYAAATPVPIQIPGAGRQSGQQQQPGTPGAPLNISPSGPGGPSWFDRIRNFLGGSPAPQSAPLPNPPVSTPVGEPGTGPTPSPDNTPPSWWNSIYGPGDYLPRQGGGPVAPPSNFIPAGGIGGVPGYAGGVMNAMGAPSGAPMAAPVIPGPPSPAALSAISNMPQAGTPLPAPPAGAFPAANAARGYGAGLFNRFPPPGYTAGGSIF
jgi:hypothetical protein